MTKQEIIQLIEVNTPKNPQLRELAITCIDKAYDEGFNEGLKWATATMKAINEDLLHANDCPECHVSLNKDGSCPSCEQDHADNVREAGK